LAQAEDVDFIDLLGLVSGSPEIGGSLSIQTRVRTGNCEDPTVYAELEPALGGEMMRVAL